jgi:hypothetical protein
MVMKANLGSVIHEKLSILNTDLLFPHLQAVRLGFVKPEGQRLQTP